MILYYNFRLTGSRIYHTCPRPSYQNGRHDPKILRLPSQLDIALATLKSYSIFNPDFLFINIELDKFDSKENRDLFENIIYKFFSSTTIIELNWSRPSCIYGWLDQAHKLKTISNGKHWILCNWNHDHPLIEFNQKAIGKLARTISAFFSIHNPLTSYFAITHQPEANAILARKFNVYGKKHDCIKDETAASDSEFETVVQFSKENPGGVFIARAEFLLNIYSRILSMGNTIPEYMPRLDFPGIPFPDMEFSVGSTYREFIAHFDGYTHNSSLSRFMHGLSIDQNGKILLRENSNLLSNIVYIFKRNFFLSASRFLKSNNNYQHFMLFCYTAIHKFICAYHDEVAEALIDSNFITSTSELRNFEIYESIRNYFYTIILEDFPAIHAEADLLT